MSDNKIQSISEFLAEDAVEKAVKEERLRIAKILEDLSNNTNSAQQAYAYEMAHYRIFEGESDV